MSATRWVEIPLVSFEKLTGTTFAHFAANVLRGDAWGSFLKIASLVEAASKRAIGVKLGLDPSSHGVGRINFSSALVLCKDAGLITAEAYEFADYLRQVRNDLVHRGGVLKLDIEQLRGIGFFNQYRKRVEAFASIQGMSLADGERQHLNTLLLGSVAYVGQLAKTLFNEEWFNNGE